MKKYLLLSLFLFSPISLWAMDGQLPSYEEVMNEPKSNADKPAPPFDLAGRLEGHKWAKRKDMLNAEQRKELAEFIEIRRKRCKNPSDKDIASIFIEGLEFAEQIRIPSELHQILQNAGIKNVGRRCDINDVWLHLWNAQATKGCSSPPKRIDPKSAISGLIKHGANVNHRFECSGGSHTKGIWTPLLFAILIQDEASVENLLNAGADPNLNGESWRIKPDVKKEKNIYPLRFAHNKHTIAELLEKYGAKGTI